MIPKAIVKTTLSGFLSLFIAGASPAQAKGTAIPFLQKTIAKYNSAAAVQSDVNKKVFLALLEETKSSDGQLFYAKKSMRLELKGEEKSLVIMNKDNIWLETSGATEEDKPQVTQIIAKDLSRQGRAPIALIFGQSTILNQFKVKSDETLSGVRKISLTPKDSKKWKDLQSFYAEVNVKDGVIELAQYEDDLQNRTTFRFSNTKFSADFDKKIFDYKPPKNAEVTVYK